MTGNFTYQTNEFDSIAIGEVTLTLREMCASDEYYQLLSGWLQEYASGINSQHDEVVKSLVSENTALKADLADMEIIRNANFDLDLRCTDLESKRNAAVAGLEEAQAELEDAQAEVRRLAADNEALRKQIEVSSKPINTNVTADLAEMAKRLQDAKPAIYDKRWEDVNRKTHYLANRADTGEEIRFGYLEAGQYREVSPEEAERFRAEYEASQQAEAAAVVEENHADSPLVDYPKPPALPSEEEVGIVQSGTAGGTMVPEELEARLAEVERQVRQLNMQVFNTLEFAAKDTSVA